MILVRKPEPGTFNCQADLIVSGDRHLHGLGGQYQGIPIVAPAQAAQQIGI